MGCTQKLGIDGAGRLRQSAGRRPASSWCQGLARGSGIGAVAGTVTWGRLGGWSRPDGWKKCCCDVNVIGV